MSDLVDHKPYRWVVRRLFLIGTTMVALLVWVLSGPAREANKNPILNEISSGYKIEDNRVQMTRNIFGKTVEYSEVEHYLTQHGFKPVHNPLNFWNESVAKKGEKAFHRAHGTWVCDIDYWVFLSLDNENKLIRAEGRKQSAACL